MLSNMRWTMKFLLVVIPVLIAAPAHAAGELMVHPTRLVFEGTNRTAQIDLINSGTEPMTYRVSVVNRRMTETGDFLPVEAPAPGDRFANQMIRFSPRQVVLQPGVAQTVRLQLRKPGDITDGEYRTHLLFQVLPPPPSNAAPQEPSAPEAGLDIRLTAIYSVSIPVIVRHGTTTAAVSLRDLELHRPASGPPALAVTVERTGSRSVYGDLTVHLRSAGRERVVGRANGVAVYTPNSVRRVVLPLPALKQGIPAGELRVTFQERPEQSRRVEAQARLAVR